MQVGDAKDKRYRSNIIDKAISTRHYFRYRFAGKLHIECVRAKLNLVPPSNPSVRSNVHGLEIGAVIPNVEYAPSSQML